jgi:hypothetical protein
MSTANEPIDATDERILEQLRLLHDALDPPPADLVERIKFAMALENLDVEVCRLQEEMFIGSGARAAERTRTITFDSESMTIMVSIAEVSQDHVRLDGWLAPPARAQVELRRPAAGEHSTAIADEFGRFVFERVARGLAQLVVLRPTGEPGPNVATPSLIL